MKVEKCGDDLSIRLPAWIVQLLRLKDSDEMDIRVSGPDTLDVEKHGGGFGRSGRVGRRVHQRHPGAARA